MAEREQTRSRKMGCPDRKRVIIADRYPIPTQEEMRQTLAARHGAAVQECFSRAVVAVCGLGGLGSNIAIALARAGIGKLILIDFDRVDITNLHRQQYKVNQIGRHKAEAMAENLKEIAPYTEVEIHTVKVDEVNACELLSGAGIVCEAFDNAEAKAMLTDVVLEQLPECYLVAASGMAGFGSANEIRTRRVTERFYLCGDGVSEVTADSTLVSARVMLCASHQAQTALRILLGIQED